MGALAGVWAARQLRSCGSGDEESGPLAFMGHLSPSHANRALVMRFTVVLLMLVGHGAGVAQVVRWVEDDGTVHYGSKAPPRHEKSAKQIATIDTRLTEAQQRESRARMRAYREYLQKRQADPQEPAPQSVVPSKATASTRHEDLSCQERWKLYDEAYGCLNAYRTANGAVKAEGFERCPVIVQPEPCGRSHVP